MSAEPAPPASVRRVLFVVNTLPPFDLSGAGEQVVQLAEALRAKGVEVDLLGRGTGGAKGPKVLFPLTVLAPLVVALRRRHYDAVQVHESDGGLVAVWLRVRRVWSRARAPKLIALLQVSYDEEARAVRPLVDERGRVLGTPVRSERRFRRWRTPVQRLLGRFAARCADVILVPSEITGGEVQRDYGGVDPHVLYNIAGHRDGMPTGERAQPQGDEAPRFLFVGRLRIRKGVEILLHALRELRDSGIHTELRLVGDGERRESLEALSKKLGIADRVRFLGQLDGADIDRELSKARALVVPSTYEGMPLVVLEAMEAAKPVIASTVSGIPEVVRDPETGWLVPHEHVAALVGALREAALDAEEAKGRGVRGRQRLERYRPARIASRWLEILDGVRENG